jgi:acetyl esterase
MDQCDKAPIDPVLLQVIEASGLRFDRAAGVEAARAQFCELANIDLWPQLRTTDYALDTDAGHRLPIRVYWPPHRTDDNSPLPIVVYCHGGGFALGDIDSYHSLVKYHATGADSIVVSIDYRLAPEHPYPAAVEDVWAATQWVAEHAVDLGADPNRLAVAGDSAGGNLAAVVAQLARDAGGPPIAFQLLWYPTTHWDFTLPSVIENADAPLLTVEAMQAFIHWYAQDVDLTNPPPTLVPAKAATFAGLPAAYIAVAAHDPLQDDGTRYAHLLAAAGVPVEIHCASTLIHGYAYFTGIVPAATEAIDRGLAALKAALHA